MKLTYQEWAWILDGIREEFLSNQLTAKEYYTKVLTFITDSKDYIIEEEG